MEVTIHNTAHLRHIRYYGHDLSKIEPMQRERDILKSLYIIIIGINLQAHTIGGLQFQVCRNSHIWCQKHIVARINAERLISKRMLTVIQRHSNASCLHNCKSTYIHDSLLMGIVNDEVNRCSIREERAFCLSREHILRIILAVLNINSISNLFRIRSQYSLYPVKLQRLGFESINGHLTIDTRNR